MGRISGQDSPGSGRHKGHHRELWAQAEGLERCLCLPRMPFRGRQKARGILENRLC